MATGHEVLEITVTVYAPSEGIAATLAMEIMESLRKGDVLGARVHIPPTTSRGPSRGGYEFDHSYHVTVTTMVPCDDPPTMGEVAREMERRGLSRARGEEVKGDG